MDAQPRDSSPSRRYTIMLTAAIVLFLVTLTIAIMIIIIANARETDREAEIEVTLTAAFAQIDQLQTVAAPGSTTAPQVVPGEYAFAPVDRTPLYAAAAQCDVHLLTGQVIDQDGAPLDGFVIWVWGDYLDPQRTMTGEIAQQPAGSWLLALEGNINRRVWVQMIADRRYVSAPVEIVFEAGDCTQNHASVTLQQIAPLN